MPRQLSQEDVLTKIAEMEKENADSKAMRKSKKVLWKEQSLKDSLYNKDEKEGRIPKIDDIDQFSYSHLHYLLKQKGINDCYLLTNLMELARKQPNFIVNNLITVTGDDKVDVNFYKVQPVFGDQKIVYQSDGTQVHYNVKKSEALTWKTCHKALWPVVVEIAFAKYLRDIWNAKEETKEFKASLRKSAEEYVRDNVEEKLSDEDFEKRVSEILNKSGMYYDGDLRDSFGIGNSPAYALTILTGKKSKIRLNLDFKKLIAPTTESGLCTYSDSVLKIYNKIKNKLDRGKIITVAFNTKGYRSLKSLKLSSRLNLPGLGDSDDDVALKTIALAKLLKRDAVGSVQKLVEEDIIDEKQVDEWMAKNKLTLEDLRTKDDKVRKKFVLETVYSNLDDYESSTTKTDIISSHAYLVVDAIEWKGRKYIIIRNPHGMKTKINYLKGKRALPPEAILPRDLYKAKNECSVELNHFCKLVSSINYDM